jgi:GMP synthase-like glutamine amidotransferase
MRILVLEHESDAPAALLAEWADSRGHDLDVVAVPRLRGWPSADGVGAVVTLGSEVSVHSSRAWVAREIEFLAAAHAQAVPILGICFGGQILSQALGGDVRRAPSAEVVWREIETGEPGLIPPGPWLLWHEDVFTLPPGAQLLAGSDAETMAFAHGVGVGIQFHPEADASVARGWIAGAREKLHSYGVDVAELEREIDRYAPTGRDRAFDLFDRIAAFWTEVGEHEHGGRPAGQTLG